MPVDADLMKLHRRPMNVWVEDALTSEYLNEAWGDPRILLLIAGSSQSVRPVVLDACRNGAKNVFGIIDRDFESTNESRWSTVELRHFILPVHEMENYLLDAKSLAGCGVNNRNRSEREIENQLLIFAQSMRYWMAANSVIKKMRQLCLDDFMLRPSPVELRNAKEIWTYIQQTSWFQQFPTRSSQITSASEIQCWIRDAVQQFEDDLSNGNWKQTYSGKEIARQIRGFIYEPPRKPVVSSATHDIDLAQSIGRWQIENDCVPEDLQKLLSLIRLKAGI